MYKAELVSKSIKSHELPCRHVMFRNQYILCRYITDVIKVWSAWSLCVCICVRAHAVVRGDIMYLMYIMYTTTR